MRKGDWLNTLWEAAPPLEELVLEDKTLTERSGSSCPLARAAPATVAGGGGKHLERISLEQGENEH